MGKLTLGDIYLVTVHGHISPILMCDYQSSHDEIFKLGWPADRFVLSLGQREGILSSRLQQSTHHFFPGPTETFDVVFGMVVLHHVERRDLQFRNIRKALDQINGVLKPGGCFGYTELFNKNRIRTYVTNAGFEKIFAKRNYLVTDSCVYRRMN